MSILIALLIACFCFGIAFVFIGLIAETFFWTAIPFVEIGWVMIALPIAITCVGIGIQIVVNGFGYTLFI